MYKLWVHFPCKYSLIFASNATQKYLNEQIIKEQCCPCNMDAESVEDEQLGSDGTIYISFSGGLLIMPRKSGFSLPAAQLFGSLNGFCYQPERERGEAQGLVSPGRRASSPAPSSRRGERDRRLRGLSARSVPTSGGSGSRCPWVPPPLGTPGTRSRGRTGGPGQARRAMR